MSGKLIHEHAKDKIAQTYGNDDDPTIEVHGIDNIDDLLGIPLSVMK